MLLYLGHTWRDIAFVVNQCARYTFELKQSHDAALKQIGRYLKGAVDKGLVLDLDNNYNIDCYLDADCAGLYGYKDQQDPHCVQSRTGYAICLAGCPVLWVGKLQTEIALSILE